MKEPSYIMKYCLTASSPHLFIYRCAGSLKISQITATLDLHVHYKRARATTAAAAILLQMQYGSYPLKQEPQL